MTSEPVHPAPMRERPILIAYRRSRAAPGAALRSWLPGRPRWPRRKRVARRSTLGRARLKGVAMRGDGDEPSTTTRDLQHRRALVRRSDRGRLRGARLLAGRLRIRRSGGRSLAPLRLRRWRAYGDALPPPSIQRYGTGGMATSQRGRSVGRGRIAGGIGSKSQSWAPSLETQGEPPARNRWPSTDRHKGRALSERVSAATDRVHKHGAGSPPHPVYGGDGQQAAGSPTRPCRFLHPLHPEQVRSFESAVWN